MFKYIICLIFVLAINHIDCNVTSSCTIDDLYKLFGTKTSYEEVRARNNEHDFRVDGCTAHSMWFLTRHGSRYPEEEEIDEILQILPKVKSAVLAAKSNSLCDREKELIKNWEPSMSEFDDHNITIAGMHEMKELAARMRKRFVDILYNKAGMYYARGALNRTQVTIEHFMNEFFANMESLIPDVDIIRKDKILDYPSSCKKLKSLSLNTTVYCKHEKDFTKTPRYTDAVKELFTRLNITKIKGVKDSDVFSAVYKACIYEFMIRNRTDESKTWCAPFTKSMLQTVELKYDLIKHCEYGYKYRISSESSCELRKNLIDYLRSILASPNPSSANTLFFTQGSTLLPFLSSLGLYKTPIVTNDEYEEIDDREWRSSRLDPMNSNILFVVYKCSKSFKMKMFHNEKPIRFAPAACDSNNVCDISRFVKYLALSTDACDFKSTCASDMSEEDLL